MLSMAYGDDQRGGLQAHRPEVCYPAQGFKLGKVEDGALPTPFGTIDVRRLTTSLGARNEPVTYWLTVGDQVIKNKFDKRIAEIRLGLTGQIPDGLLFRVSSIDNDPARAFAMQQKFAADMMAAVPAETRRQLSGLARAGERELIALGRAAGGPAVGPAPCPAGRSKAGPARRRARRRTPAPPASAPCRRRRAGSPARRRRRSGR